MGRPKVLDVFTTAYVDCALWVSTDDNGESLDIYTVDDIADETLTEMVEDCAAFQESHWDDIADNLAGAGGDFYLTRNRHGAGFWDGDWGGAGRRLTDASHVYGTQVLYVGDDGRIYSHG